jgi:hypothetical protein
MLGFLFHQTNGLMPWVEEEEWFFGIQSLQL